MSGEDTFSKLTSVIRSQEQIDKELDNGIAHVREAIYAVLPQDYLPSFQQTIDEHMTEPELSDPDFEHIHITYRNRALAFLMRAHVPFLTAEKTGSDVVYAPIIKAILVDAVNTLHDKDEDVSRASVLAFLDIVSAQIRAAFTTNDNHANDN